MRSNRWISFLGGRYMQTAGNSRGHASVRLSILGISAGVMTLVTVLSVMNGFQSSTIRNILEVSSYHLRVESEGGSEFSDETLREARELPNVTSVVPFTDVQALARGFFQRPATVLLRAVPADLQELDPGLAEQLEIVEGSFDLERERGVVIGSELGCGCLPLLLDRSLGRGCWRIRVRPVGQHSSGCLACHSLRACNGPHGPGAVGCGRHGRCACTWSGVVRARTRI